MAIFRGGKRVGPFDIRIGFPRDKSLVDVDKDPRLSQRANTENTIGRFRSMMARAEGYARPARFAVRIFPPGKLTELAGLKTNKTTAPGQSGGATALHPDAAAMHSLWTEIGQQINIHCDSISMPGHDLNSQTVQYFGPERKQVNSHAYSGTINATFYADKYLRERHFFEMWQKMCISNITHKAGYYDDYIGKLQIFQLGSLDGAGNRDVPTYGIEATEVYPEQVASIDYSYKSSNQLTKVTIQFQYKQWYNMTTDSVNGMTFGASQQTLHDVKPGKQGWLDRLPPELGRTARNVVNQAKTQLPIGRLTRGKIFPPFT